MTEGLDVRIHGAVSPATAEAIACVVGDAYERLAPLPRAPWRFAWWIAASAWPP